MSAFIFYKGRLVVSNVDFRSLCIFALFRYAHPTMKLSSAIIAGFVVAINAQQHGEKSAEGFGDWFEATHPDSKDGSSICDRYAGSILGANTLETQQLLITLFVNTALVGNYTTPNVGIRVPGIIWPGEFQGKPINQMPYFDGSLASSNVGKDLGHGQAINWLDGGGPAALRSNVSAFNVTSNQLYVPYPLNILSLLANR